MLLLWDFFKNIDLEGDMTSMTLWWKYQQNTELTCSVKPLNLCSLTQDRVRATSVGCASFETSATALHYSFLKYEFGIM